LTRGTARDEIKEIEMTNTTRAQRPPMQPSDEATEEQLKLAQAQGDAYVKALQEMTQREAHGGEREAGEYIVGYAVEDAEGMYHQHDGKLMWMEAGEENAHIEIAVRDGADNRFIPGLTVQVTVVDAQGKEVGTHVQEFLWHPWLYHYGRNWRLPGDGEYTLRVRIEAPEFMRHDKTNGKRFAEPVEVEFSKVKIKTGQKKS
jgi:hypothetical protein